MHDECVALMCAIREGRVRAHTSSFVIAEIVWTLKSFYKLSKQDVLEAVQGIVSLRNMHVVSEERVEMAL
jgi:predicted nucleic-acid-binding protein